MNWNLPRMDTPPPNRAQPLVGADLVGGWAPGSGGELFQGWVEGRGWRQVALPVAVGRWACADPGGEGEGDPPGPRVRALLEHLAERLPEAPALRGAGAGSPPTPPPPSIPSPALPPLRLGGDDLAPGAGLGSSTADLGAVLAALEALGLLSPSSPLDRARLALAVEPTNSTLLPGLTLFDHREGRDAEWLGPVPPLEVVLLVPGTRLETRVFNAGLPLPDARSREGWARALALLREGAASGDLSAVGEAATRSARLRDEALAVPGLSRPTAADLQALLGRAPASVRREVVGIVASHSGTAAGYLMAGPASELARWLGHSLASPGEGLPAPRGPDGFASGPAWAQPSHPPLRILHTSSHPGGVHLAMERGQVGSRVR